MTLTAMSEENDRRFYQHGPISPGPSHSPQSRSPGSSLSHRSESPLSKSDSPVSFATDLSISGSRVSPARVSPVLSPVRRFSPIPEARRSSPMGRMSNHSPRSPVRHQPPAHQSALSKCSNFSINSILSKSHADSKESSPSPPAKSSLRDSPEKTDRSPLGPLSPHEALMKMDAAHMNLAAAAAAFHPGLNPAFLERTLPGGLPGKPTPWYPWFAAAAGAYLPFPFDRKY